MSINWSSIILHINKNVDHYKNTKIEFLFKVFSKIKNGTIDHHYLKYTLNFWIGIENYFDNKWIQNCFQNVSKSNIKKMYKAKNIKIVFKIILYLEK